MYRSLMAQVGTRALLAHIHSTSSANTDCVFTVPSERTTIDMSCLNMQR